ncbi:MAG: methyltransferase domain-containing protein [Mitsuokella sp.]|uniref:methyltransferase domain-containing protein n=1 Tax=Mitsuokella sp. TaxID=2049034 RepID=UPI003F110220
MNEIVENVKKYYGKVLDGTKDLKTKACCCGSALPKQVKEALALVDDEIVTHYYGCGSPIPDLLDGMTVLDLGCGTGRDVYVASKLVGENGHVIGVDMTQEQLDIALRHKEDQYKRFGYQKSNVVFKKGYIEDLKSLGIEDNSVDIVISNCVINLSPYKEEVFKEIWRVLKPGGELYFSDVFTDRRIPAKLYADPVLHGECISGAMYYEDFRRLLRKAGFMDFVYMNIRDFALGNEEIEQKVGFAHFSERTVRAFKLSSLEDACEDYGQVAVYNGTIPNHPHAYDFDMYNHFVTGKPMLVSGNLASMLEETRFSSAFTIHGDRSVHFGAFGASAAETSNSNDGGCC